MKTVKAPRKLFLPISAVVAVVAYYILWVRPVSLAGEVHQLRECWDRKDFACVARFIRTSELEAYHLSPEQAQVVLEKYFDPVLVESNELSKVRFDRENEGLNFILLDDKNQAVLGGIAVAGNRKVTIPNFLNGLILTAADKKFAGGGPPSVVKSYTAYYRLATEDGPVLEKYGLSGIVTESTVIPWARWAEMCKKVVDERKARS